MNRYVRTGPGTDNDGEAKFDLDQINPAYLARLRSRVQDCYENGIYAVICLFNGFNIESKGFSYQPFAYHPYNEDNNINSVDGDFNSDGQGTETHTDTNNAAWSYQLALVEAIIDELNDFPNVMWEISNESTGSTGNTAWQYALIDHIRDYEATKPLQHMIGMSVCWPNGSNAVLDASGADFVQYNGDKADAVHSDADPVSVYDDDHTTGGGTGYAWIHQALCNGHGGVSSMDDWDYDGDAFTAPWELKRDNLGYAADLVALIGSDLLLMTPQAGLSTSGYCLARNHATVGKYVAFYDGSGTFNLNLSTATGTLQVRWLRCSNGDVSTSTVAGGDTRTMTPPWTGAVVLYVYHQGGGE